MHLVEHIDRRQLSWQRFKIRFRKSEGHLRRIQGTGNVIECPFWNLRVTTVPDDPFQWSKSRSGAESNRDCADNQWEDYKIIYSSYVGFGKRDRTQM